MTGDTSPIRRLAGMLSRKASELRTGAKASSQGAVQDPGSIAVVLDDAAKIEPARVINTPGTAAPQPPRLKTGTLLLYVGLAAVLLAPGLLLGSTRDLSAWQRAMLDITFGRGLRFWLGVLGAVLLVLLLLYPVRKLLAHRFRISSVGKWFNLHTIVGILVTLLILYHANFSFSVRDVSASAALFATLVIFVSGIVGHFVYTSASVDYYRTKKEVRSSLDSLIADLKALEASGVDVNPTIGNLERFERDVPSSRLGLVESFRRTMRIQLHHGPLYGELRALLAEAQLRNAWPQQEYQRQLKSLGSRLGTSVSLARRASGRSMIEQLVARWRYLHLPFVVLMSVSTVMHVWWVWDNGAYRSLPRLAASAPAVTSGAGVKGATPSYSPEEAIAALERWNETTSKASSGQQFFATSFYVGSESCKGCHQEQHREWANTWHAKMYRLPGPPVTDDTVVGAFDGKALKFDRVSVRSEDGKSQGPVSFEVIPEKVHPVTRAPGFFFTVRDPSTPTDNQTFQVAIIIGGNLEQSYHIRFDDGYFPAPLRWKVGDAVSPGAWQIDGTPQPGNWVFYRGDNKLNGKPRSTAQLPFDRSAESQCMGCHTTGYRFERESTAGEAPWRMIGTSTKIGVAPDRVLTGPANGAPGTKAELGIGCERCHGPGSAHNAAQDVGAGNPTKPLVTGLILNPIKHLSALQQSMMCAQCHLRGTNDITAGTKADGQRKEHRLAFPDTLPTQTGKPADKGFLPGDVDLAGRFKLTGGYAESSAAFWPNELAKQGRMQWQDHAKSPHHTTGAASCLTCHSGHAPMHERINNDRFQLRHSRAVLIGKSTTETQCESCHRVGGTASQPNKEMFEGSIMQQSGVTCIDCHMPRVGNRIGKTTATVSMAPGGNIAGDGKHWDVSSHMSRVVSTSESASGVRSACVSCHGSNPRSPVGTSQSDAKLDDAVACRKEYIGNVLKALRPELSAIENRKNTILGKARSRLDFVAADRSWGMHNWEKSLTELQFAASDINAACGADASCKRVQLPEIRQECSIRRIDVTPPPAVVQADLKPATGVPARSVQNAGSKTEAKTNATPKAAGPVEPPAVSLSAEKAVYRKGDEVKFRLTVRRKSHLYCYLEDKASSAMQIVVPAPTLEQRIVSPDTGADQSLSGADFGAPYQAGQSFALVCYAVDAPLAADLHSAWKDNHVLTRAANAPRDVNGSVTATELAVPSPVMASLLTALKAIGKDSRVDVRVDP